MRSTRTRDNLHAALERGEWSAAEELLEVFGLEVEESWGAAASAEERLAISQDVIAFVQWARAMAITSRAHARSRLDRLNRGQAYAEPQASSPYQGLDA